MSNPDEHPIDEPVTDAAPKPAEVAEMAEMAESAVDDHEPQRGHGDNVLPFPTAPRPDPDECDDADPLLRDVLGDVLRDERLDQDRTLADVAGDAAVSLPYLSEIERGRKEVSSDVLAAIIGSLDLDLAEVLKRAADRLRANELRMRSDGRSPQALLLAA